jgi:hypothetical protein
MPSASTGLDQALPESSVFQTTFLVSPHSTGSLAVAARPSPPGPRNWFQESAHAPAASQQGMMAMNNPTAERGIGGDPSKRC